MTLLIVVMVSAVDRAHSLDDVDRHHQALKRCSKKIFRSRSDSSLNVDRISVRPFETTDPLLFKRAYDKHRTSDLLQVSENILLSNCSSYDVNTLMNSLESSFKQGIACLNDLGPRWKKDAQRLSSILDGFSRGPLVIRCQITDRETVGNYLSTKQPLYFEWGEAQSFSCDNSLFPGFILSKHYLSRGIENTPSTLFHEFVHTLGYTHTAPSGSTVEGYDIVYSLESCCFPGSMDSRLNPQHDPDHACERLRRNSS